MYETPTSETPSQTLARSAFGFAVVAWIPALIAWIMILLAGRSPSPLFQQIHTAILIGTGILTALLFFLCIRLYRTSIENLIPASERVVAIFGKAPIAWVVVLLVLEINLLTFRVLYNVAPNLTNAGKFLLVCWSLLAFGMLITINRAALAAWIQRTQAIWITIGMAICGLVLIAGIQVVNNWLVTTTGIDDRLRGGLDYRALTFYDDGIPAPAAAAFWQEQAQTRVRWSPYTYWVMDEFSGAFINIDSRGLRYTPDYSTPESLRIDVYGGSTVWGEGARDAYTIAGHLARLLAEQNTPQHVYNFGQTGYVSTQDLIWFQLQLSSGDIPDVAIFYQGFNDILSAWGAGKTGITLQEDMRMNDSEAGRILRSGQPVLALPGLTISDFDLSSAAVEDTSAQAILTRWFANKRLIESMAAVYGVDVLFVWQPAIIYKDPLTAAEQAIMERWEAERPGLFDLYRETDQLLRMQLDQHPNLLVLSDLFEGEQAEIFHDLVHITEQGNLSAAQAILSRLNQQQANP